MRFQPRYSLLTLLVLTALIAGGVKLWYGPHHAVERPSPNLEDEYTYTRGWTGSKIVHGPRFLRYHNADGSLDHIMIEYYRQGMNLKQDYKLIALKPLEVAWVHLYRDTPLPLTMAEDEEFDKAIKQEADLIHSLGLKPCYPEYNKIIIE
jgi:hypothetical protein